MLNGNSDAGGLRELTRFLREIREPMDHIWPQFWDWQQLHPDVEERLVGLMRRAVSNGRRRYGISPLWEVLRWHTIIEKSEEFKCSNSYRSRYARYLMWKYPEMEGFFELRTLRAMPDLTGLDTGSSQ